MRKISVMRKPSGLAVPRLTLLAVSAFIAALPAICTAENPVGRRAGEEWEANGPKMKFRWCPPGEFEMGSPFEEEGHNGDETQATVRLTHGFWLGQFEVTQAQWQSVMHTSPWKKEVRVREGINYPATNVNCYDALEFCRKLTELERAVGRLSEESKYTLPTEAQWEYACRAGTSTSYSFGPDEARLGDYAWFHDNTDQAGEKFPHEVGLKKANAWGFHDMHGNVWEWCRDEYRRELPGGNDPFVSIQKVHADQVFRGGDFRSQAVYCRAAQRAKFWASLTAHIMGFRVVLVSTPN